MPEGFFKASKLVQHTPAQSLVALCGACGLFKTCKSPKMKVAGKGRAEILIVGEAPGREEDQVGKPFVGVSGRLLNETLHTIGVDLYKDCWMTNALICRPPKNATPEDKQIMYCRPNLTSTLDELKPKTVILLGKAALSSFLRPYWRSKISLGAWVGMDIPLQKRNCWVCPTWHPSYILRSEKNGHYDPVLYNYFVNHLLTAVSHKSRPWETIPDYAKQVRLIYNSQEAAEEIISMIGEEPIGIDLETNMLKPDSEEAAIISCALSNGKKTIAYPWVGKAIDKTKLLVQSDTPLISGNLKFEERWFLRFFNHGATNWYGDTVIDAHIADNRDDITSVKFQALALLGLESYNSGVAPYLEAKGGNQKNRIHEIEMNDLLRYNGIDALVEVLINQQQRRRRKNGL